jgi:ketosteroid isomerase-like protein
MNENSIEEFIRAFDDAWGRNDVDAAVALFTEDATLESPLVIHLLHRKDGVLHGRDEIRPLVAALMERGTSWGSHEAPLVRGNMIAIEFRTPASQGGEFFSVDIIELRNGKIKSLRAYTGWRAQMATRHDGAR